MIPASLLDIDLTAPLQDAELTTLDEALLNLSNRLVEARGEEADFVRDVAELDGFLLAVVSSPAPLVPEQWLPALWGGAMPEFISLAEEEKVIALILRHHNATARLMERFPDNYEPVFSYDVDDDGNEFESVESWCVGFLRGMELCWEGWEAAMELQPELFDALFLFGTEDGLAERESWTDEEVDELQDQMPDITRWLAAVGREQRAKTPTIRREAPKVGRNDPCPCGSGKKHKQCCGA